MPKQKKFFLSQLKPALKLFWKNRLLVGLCGLIDVAFFAVLAFIHYDILRKIAGHTQILILEVQKVTFDVLSSEEPLPFKQMLMDSPQFVTAYHQIIKYMLILILLAFIAWLVFKSINWYLANKIVKQKINFWNYAKYFLLYSILWFFGVIVILVAFMTLTSYSTNQMLPLIGKTGTKIITAILFAILAYFAFISFSLIPKTPLKKILQTSVKKWRQIVPAHITVLAITFLAAYIPLQIAAWQNPYAYWAVLAFAVLVSIPALTYGRIYISLIVNKV